VNEPAPRPDGPSDPVHGLAAALDQTGRIVEALNPDQESLPTPCGEWDVKALAEHVVRDLRMFTARATGASWEDQTPSLDPDRWAEVYRSSAGGLIEAWREGGSLDEVVELPFGKVPRSWFLGQQLSDVIVHGWDLAKATGQPFDVDPSLASDGLGWGRENLLPEYRGKDFGPEVPVPEDAPAIDRLVGFFGRDPNWTPPEG
jgi:uncharacterized protein (TIGR03086 family)